MDCLLTLLDHPAAADEAVALLASFDPSEWNDTSYIAADPEHQNPKPQAISSSIGWAANTGVFGDSPHRML